MSQLIISIRVAHAVKNYLPTEYLENVGKFLHLCLWGHEHECLIDPTISGKDSFFITQPGSSIATSLCEGEAVEKYHTDSPTDHISIDMSDF